VPVLLLLLLLVLLMLMLLRLLLLLLLLLLLRSFTGAQLEEWEKLQLRVQKAERALENVRGCRTPAWIAYSLRNFN